MAYRTFLVYVFLINLMINIMGMQAWVNTEMDPDDNETAIPGEYIVSLKLDAPIVQTIPELVEKGGFFPNGMPKQFLNMTTKRRHIIGRRQFFTITGDELYINALGVLPSVANFAPNMKIKAFDDMNFTTTSTPEKPKIVCVTQDVPMLWGLDRIDQRNAESAESNKYVYGSPIGDGTGVNAYVVDSGLDYDDPEFGGRAILGYSHPSFKSDEDDSGHGTHVAGTVGGDTYGVAKKVNIIGVKVLNWRGSGSSATLIDGLAWVVQDFVKRGKPNSVVNLSLGVGGISAPADTAVQEVIDAGITVVGAAGNDREDACGVTPAHVDDVITVGASDINDNAASSFTNWGKCLDIWAPGDKILSIEPRHLSLKSGTSMAAPHVTGAIARYLSTMTSQKPTPAEVAHWLDSLATKDKLTFTNDDIASSPNKLLYLGCAEDWAVSAMGNETEWELDDGVLFLSCPCLVQLCGIFSIFIISFPNIGFYNGVAIL